MATPIVARMDELFSLDAEARRKGLTIAARHVRRQETAKDLLDDIRSKIEAAQSVALPSALSKACQYALTLWKKLTRFLEYPEFRAKYQSGCAVSYCGFKSELKSGSASAFGGGGAAIYRNGRPGEYIGGLRGEIVDQLHHNRYIRRSS
jgi:hypothetical protein